MASWIVVLFGQNDIGKKHGLFARCEAFRITEDWASNKTNQPQIPHLPPKYPHPNSHYRPLTTKAFMKIGVIATGVASSVTLDKICPIILELRRVMRVYLKFQSTCYSPTQGAWVFPQLEFAFYRNLVYDFIHITIKLRQIMNTFSASGLLLQYRRFNRKRTKPSPLTLVYAFILSSGAAMLYLTVSLSHHV